MAKRKLKTKAKSYIPLKLSEVERPKSLGLLASDIFSDKDAYKTLGISKSYLYKLRKMSPNDYSDNIAEKLLSVGKKLGLDEKSMYLDIDEKINIQKTEPTLKLLQNRRVQNVQVTFKFDKSSGLYESDKRKGLFGFSSFVAERKDIKDMDLLNEKIEEYINSLDFGPGSNRDELFITSISIRSVE